MIQYLRSIIFYLLYGCTGAIAGLASLLLWLAPYRFRYNAISQWNTAALWFAKTIMGTNYTVTGLENIPTVQPYVVLCKVQSTWESYRP